MCLPSIAAAGPDACSFPVAGTAVCAGNQSAGITNQGIAPDFSSPPVTTLIVENLTANIAPVSTGGINFDNLSTGGPITIITSGPFGIVTDDTAISADTGQRSPVNVPGGAISITNGLQITINNDATGIFASSGAPASAAEAAALGGAVTIVNTGTIVGTGKVGGIIANSQGGVVGVTNSAAMTFTGALEAIGISAAGTLGNVSVDNSGAIAISGSEAVAIAAGTVVFSQDTVQTGRLGDVAISNTGTLTMTGGDALAGLIGTSFDLRGTALTGNVLIENSAPIGVSAGTVAFGALALANGDSSSASIVNGGAVTVAGSDGGGLAALSVGTGATASITTTTGVSATGADTSAIIIGAAGTGATSSVVVGPGAAIVGGSASGAGVTFLDGSVDLTQAVQVDVTDQQELFDALSNVAVDPTGVANALENRGTISAQSGMAVQGGRGDETIRNFGTLIGNIDLGSGTNAVFNEAGGVIVAGTTIDLGGGTLTNAGTLSPGGSGTIQSTAITGNLVQTAAGTLAIDINPATGQADLVSVSGTASLAGRLLLNQVGSGPAPGSQQITVVTATGGITDNGIVLDNTGVVNYELIFAGASNLDLRLVAIVTTDFAPDGLNRNQTALGRYINAIQAAGGSTSLATLIQALAALPDVASLAAAYDGLSPELYLKGQIAGMFSSLSFADSLMSCRVRDGGHAFIREGQCLWAEASGRLLDQDRTSQSVGFDEETFRFAAGAQFRIGTGTSVNVAAGYEHASLQLGSASSDVERALLGAAVKHEIGPLMLVAAVSGSYGRHDDRRNLAFPGFAGVARAEHDVGVIAGRLRAAWLSDLGGWYVKPMADLDVTHVRSDGLREATPGGGALAIRDASQTIVSFSPAIEFGGESRLADGTLLRPFARAGLTLFSETDFAVTASFLGAPAGVAGFSTVTEVDRVLGEISLGIDLLGVNGLTVRLGYDGRFGDTVREHGFGAKASVPF